MITRQTKNLPASVQQALRNVGYNKPTIQVETKHNYRTKLPSANGYQRFLVNMDTDTYIDGPWNGALDQAVNTDLSPSTVLVSGVRGGGKPTLARLVVFPTNPLATSELDAKPRLSSMQETVLRAFTQYKAAYRMEGTARAMGIDYFDQQQFKPTYDQTCEELADLGLLAVSKNGAKRLSVLGKLVVGSL